MKSRTSSSKFRVFKKDLTRFAPTWVEYSAALLIAYYFILRGDGDIAYKGSWNEFLSFFAWVNAAYGFICGVNLFGYLTDPRECNTVHAFPIRREEYFLVHTLAGFLMALVPNAVFILLNIPLAGGSLVNHFVGMMLEFVFFYGLAIFCMFLTGRKFAAATLFGLFNGLSMLIYWAVYVIYLPSLPGVVLDYEAFLIFTPLMKMMQEEGQMTILLAYAAVGLGLMIGSMLLYRRRKLEYAGDFIAIKWLTPVFLVALSIAVGCVLGAFSSLFDEDFSYFLLGFGLVLGYFTGQMLLKRTIRVFSLRSIGSAAVLAAVVFLSIFVTELDPFGRVTYVPDSNFVSSVEIRRYEGNQFFYEATDPAVIADITDLHGGILATEHHDVEDAIVGEYIHLTYRLKTGQTIIRYYRAEEPLAERVRFYMSQPEIQLGVSTVEELKKNCAALSISHYDQGTDEYRDFSLYGNEADALMEVLFRECREGKMEISSVTQDSVASISFRDASRNYWQYVDVPESATDTVAMIEKLLK